MGNRTFIRNKIKNLSQAFEKSIFALATFSLVFASTFGLAGPAIAGASTETGNAATNLYFSDGERTFDCGETITEVPDGLQMSLRWTQPTADGAFKGGYALLSQYPNALDDTEENLDKSSTNYTLDDFGNDGEGVYRYTLSSLNNGGNEHGSAVCDLEYRESDATPDIVLNPENFNTHADDKYTGVNVGFSVEDISEFNSVKVELFDSNNQLVISNEGIPSELNNLLESNVTQYSTPFIIQDLDYNSASDSYWNFGTWQSSNTPVKAIITVNGVKKQNASLATPAGSFESLLPYVTAENFNTHSGNNYKGMNVGFNINQFDTVEFVKVSLYDDDGNKITSNMHRNELLDLINDGENKHSTPFITEEKDYTEKYWQLGDYNWTKNDKPAETEIIVKNTNGLSASTKNSPLDESTALFADLIDETTQPEQVKNLQIRKGHSSDAELIGCDGFTDTTQIRIEWDHSNEENLDGYWFGIKGNEKHKWVDASENFYNGNMTPGNNPYYYTVIAVDDENNESEISQQCGVTLDQEAPTVPALNFPSDNAFLNSQDLYIEWEESNDNISDQSDITYQYRLYMENPDENLDADIRFDRDYTGTTRHPQSGFAPGTPEGVYWWRVQAIDEAGNESGFSQAWKFTIDNTAPEATLEIDGPDNDGVVTVTGLAEEENIKSHWFAITRPDGTKFYEYNLNTDDDSYTFTIDTTEKQNGEYNVRYVATDKAGNRNDDPDLTNPTTGTFAVDNTLTVDNGDTENGDTEELSSQEDDDGTEEDEAGLAVTPLATGLPGTIGAPVEDDATEEDEEEEDTGEVLDGATTEAEDDGEVAAETDINLLNWWWLILLLVLAVAGYLYYRKQQQNQTL